MMALKYKEGTSTADHVSEFQSVMNQLLGMGVKFDDGILGLWLLATLPDSWETFRVSLINSAPQEVRRISQGSTSQSEVLVTENKGRNREKDGKGRDKSRSKSRSRYKNLECHHCGKKGHIKKYCFKLKRENKGGGDKHDRNDNEKPERVATATREDLLVICDKNLINLVCEETTWVIDTGASTHVTSRRDFFTSYTPGDFGVLKMGNDGLVTVTGMEMACDGKWKLTKGSLVVARGKKSSNLYLMQASTSRDAVNVTVNDSSTELWHKRLSHMSEKGLNCLAKKNQLSGLKNATLKNCAHCLAGKQRRVSFRSHPPHRRSELLELVHSDVCGPLKVRSHGGALYFVTFIDDCSRKLWVYTLKTKDQVFETFKQFQASVERETGKKLKCIRIDNGGEYKGPFHEYCLRQGIRHQRTPPKTPQLNGLAERMNRTLFERVRCLLSDAKLPRSFWAEALNTVAHVINLSPSVPLRGDVPDSVWFGKDVSYDHMRVFCCKAFVDVPKDERSKLDVKTRQCIFIGYGLDGEFGYRLYDPVQKKLVRSRDVVFIEDQTIDDIDKMEKEDSQDNSELIDVNPVPQDPTPSPIQEDVHGDANDDQQEIGDFDAPIDDVVNDQQQAPIAPPTVPLRRSSRDRRPSVRYSSDDYVLLTDGGEPECYEEAMESECKDQWVEAMKDELQSLHDNHTFELVKLPKDKRALKNRWVYRLKQEEKSSSPRYKARLVVKGYTQKKGIDFEEIFSPVVKMSSIRTIMSLAACYDLEVEQMDVKTAFLHGDLEEELYMEQPEGFVAQGKEDYVCRLKKSLYGLKQAPRQWYKKFESVMGEQGYKKTTSDHCVFIKKFFGDDFIILLLYVDDMLIVGRNASRIDKLKQELSKSFAMKDLGPAKQILGIRLTRDREAKKLWLSHERYIEKVLQRFSMDRAKAVNTPFATHFILSVKHNLAYAVGAVSRFRSNPGREHWNAVNWIMRYLRGSSNMRLCFGNEKHVLVGYTDSDMAGDIDSRRSTSEFIAATEACKEMLWMKKFVHELGFTQEKYVLYCDSQSAIHLAKQLELEKIHTDDNGADMLTKALPRGKFEACCLIAGMETFPI
ncbi:hypothetical protein GQ457_12G004830 [Hibiscus cannabinus]